MCVTNSYDMIRTAPFLLFTEARERWDVYLSCRPTWKVSNALSRGKCNCNESLRAVGVIHCWQYTGWHLPSSLRGARRITDLIWNWTSSKRLLIAQIACAKCQRFIIRSYSITILIPKNHFPCSRSMSIGSTVSEGKEKLKKYINKKEFTHTLLRKPIMWLKTHLELHVISI